MSDLRIGHDYHLGETRKTAQQTRNTAGELVSLWEAYCDACGWVGMKRDSKAAADADAAYHDKIDV